MVDKFVTNPLTGRSIKVGGATHTKLVNEGVLKGRKKTASRSPKSPRRASKSPARKSSPRSPLRKPSTKPKRAAAKRSPRSPSKSLRSPKAGTKTNHNEVWYKKESTLKPRQKKFCSCTMEVAKRNSEKCNRSFRRGNKRKEQLTGKIVDGRKCYNPYAICASRVRTTTGGRPCGDHYNYDKLPDDELRAYGELLNISTPKPFNRKTMISNIKRYKNQE